MQTFLTTHASTEKLDLWLEFSRLGRECQTANNLSGQLLNMQQEIITTMLDRLGRGQSHAGYWEDGSDGRYGESVSLGYA
ncbi:hypothetical protein [Parendozoicomonas sp. Alg238-R29]|uniref:hypothetical protein n=1 Tax=Parendozoicomonas sp. Alg238-R29 TaxID=2993446 RepID=UPI00248F0080|nr:hypothetical protein [Parendozoicomonas sp. Alg238-R29]